MQVQKVLKVRGAGDKGSTDATGNKVQSAADASDAPSGAQVQKVIRSQERRCKRC